MTDKPLKRPRDPGKLAKLMIEIGRPPTQAGGSIVVALFLCLPALARAEDKEPFASIELGAARERSIQEGTYSSGPSVSAMADALSSARISDLAATGFSR